jgi:hypothetical protein
MAFLSMTRLRVKSIWLLPKFILENSGVINQLRSSKGFKAGKTLLDPSLAAWTVTLWENEAAMRAFFGSGAHRASLPKLSFYADEASSGHMDFAETELPDWNFVYEKLSTIGKFTIPLQSPSQNHINQIIKRPSTTLLSYPIKPY